MRSRLAAAVVILSIGCQASAADMASVSWSHSIEDAWRTAGTLDRPMLVFVTRAGCLPCARMKTTTFVDRQIAALINESYVAVAIDGSQQTPLLRDLRVNAVPATFVISPQAVILDRVEGFLSPQALAARLAPFTPQWKPSRSQPPATARAF